MLVGEEVTDAFYDEADYNRYKRAEEYVKQSRVSINKIDYTDDKNFALHSIVRGHGYIYDVFLEVKNGVIKKKICDCQDYETNHNLCKHIIATIMEFDTNEIYAKKLGIDLGKNSKIIDTTSQYLNFKKLVNAFYDDTVDEIETEDIIAEENIRIEPKLIYDKYNDNLKVEFKIGNKKMYKLKALTSFYERILNGETYRYGNSLNFKHTEMAFDVESRGILKFIIKYAEIIKYVNSTTSRYYGNILNDNYIVISNTGIDELFSIVKGKKVELEIGNEIKEINCIDETPDIQFLLKKINDDEYKIYPNVNPSEYTIINGKEYSYILLDDKLNKISKNSKNSTIKLLNIFNQNYVKEIVFSKRNLPEFFSLVMPRIKNNLNMDLVDKEKIEKFIPKQLGVKVFLDIDKNSNIICDIKFCYNDIEFNPLDLENNVNIARDIIKEAEALNIFRKTGFLLDKQNLRFILIDEEKIYNFLFRDIEVYMQKFEVLITDNFKTKQIKKPKIGTIGVKIENNLLNIDIGNLGFDKSEIKEIMEKYRLRKKYHRLKDGTFLILDKNRDLDFIDTLEKNIGISYNDILSGTIKMPVNRSVYMDKLLERLQNVEITKNEKYAEMVKDVENHTDIKSIKLPDSMEKILRYYQKTGFKWLKSLDKYNFGGILADDMGLGKTVQCISIILAYMEETEEKDKKPSIVVSPSSLSLNWKNEVEKFANNIRVLVISGNANEREKKIKKIPNYDLIITSYDLLKRDIDLYTENKLEFKYIMADEAQYIKNSNTQNARAIKEISAETKYALTGTPIENSLSELWSIFDFIMPGYLFNYRKFKQNYETPIIKEEDRTSMKRLKMMIEPFILRRTKKEVLTELPDKTITVLNNEMTENQLKLYVSYLEKAKKEVSEEINNKGLEKSHIKILALLTRLRQICCHPSLFIENYKEGSSKLNQCIEIVKDATESGHKILLFSGYTTMFEIIEKELKKENIRYFKLTGETKVDERIKLVDEFNENKDIKVFLISLKAGGTGLNLTGADVVIHYDPWWNLAAENQATDRAYRIGQKNNVQVYKLITKNSIEEKIYELQQRKAELVDNMLSTETTFISKLNKDEIMQLFQN